MRPPEEIKELFQESKASFSSEKNGKIFNAALSAYKRTQNEKSVPHKPNIWMLILPSKAGYIAAAFLIIASLVACFVLSRKNANLRDELELIQRDIAAAPTDDSTTINFYLREHQDIIARNASLNSATVQPVQMHINQDDIMYYEFLDDEPEFMRPGIIVRGPLSQRQISPSEAPVISNGHSLTISEARKTAGFDLMAPLWFHPGYSLNQIRRIEDRDALQLLYTDSISSVSLFEQPLDGQRGLSRQDFREYAVYRKAEQGEGTILAWRDDALSYVLIGNAELSQLMDMAQSISAGK